MPGLETYQPDSINPGQMPNNNFSFTEFLKGNPGFLQQIPRYSPQGLGAIQQARTMALQGLGNNQFDFDPIAQQARKGLLEQTIPSISERFAGMGGIGSSGYTNTLGNAASDLETNLAALRSQYGLQQQSQLQNLLSLGLTPEFDTAQIQRSPGFLENAAAPLASGLGQGVAAGGAALAQSAGNYIGNKLFPQNNSVVPVGQQNNQIGQQIGQQAGNVASGIAQGAAPVAAGSVLAPAAKAALGGLTTAGKFILPLGALAALGVGGYFLYNALKNKWEKKREATRQEQQSLQKLYNGTRQQQIDAGLIPLQPGWQPGYGPQAQQQPVAQQP